jgi:hypothetical protein
LGSTLKQPVSLQSFSLEMTHHKASRQPGPAPDARFLQQAHSDVGADVLRKTEADLSPRTLPIVEAVAADCAFEAAHAKWLAAQPSWLRLLDAHVLTPWWRAHRLAKPPDGNTLNKVSAGLQLEHLYSSAASRVESDVCASPCALASLLQKWAPRRGMPLYLALFLLLLYAADYLLVLLALPESRLPVRLPAVLHAVRRACLAAVPALASSSLLQAYLFLFVFVNGAFAFTSYVTTARRSFFRGMHGGFRDVAVVNAAIALMLGLAVLPVAPHLFQAGISSMQQLNASDHWIPHLAVPPPGLIGAAGAAHLHAYESGHAVYRAEEGGAAGASSGWDGGQQADASNSGRPAARAGAPALVRVSAGGEMASLVGQIQEDRGLETDVVAADFVDGAGDGAWDGSASAAPQSRRRSPPASTGTSDCVGPACNSIVPSGGDEAAEGMASFEESHHFDAVLRDVREAERLLAVARAAELRAQALAEPATAPPLELPPHATVAQAQHALWAALRPRLRAAWSVATLDGALLHCSLYVLGGMIGLHIAYLVRAGFCASSLSGRDVAAANVGQLAGIFFRVGVILYFSSHHVVWMMQEDVLPTRSALYLAALAGIVFLARRLSPRWYFHFHHWAAGIMLLPLCRADTVGLCVVLQGLLAGQMVDGAARFSCAPLFHRHRHAADYNGYQ